MKKVIEYCYYVPILETFFYIARLCDIVKPFCIRKGYYFFNRAIDKGYGETYYLK